MDAGINDDGQDLGNAAAVREKWLIINHRRNIKKDFHES